MYTLPPLTSAPSPAHSTSLSVLRTRRRPRDRHPGDNRARGHAERRGGAVRQSGGRAGGGWPPTPCALTRSRHRRERAEALRGRGVAGRGVWRRQARSYARMPRAHPQASHSMSALPRHQHDPDTPDIHFLSFSFPFSFPISLSYCP
ncbi:hypothetical protein PsYK624_097770 [Phanerochaete sordida]|uniref:Uncharacterized protein n=1 Tax=Phanerochaete sordida TaxID=48140 RepID=A0A9P3GF21_9APHY|nr:hypothetical protein PsYK624_097770 [Phanerochaete sordida]